jgi:cytochrome c biogenesis protein CcmG/thiol:disulfide interchange protein DsbE
MNRKVLAAGAAAVVPLLAVLLANIKRDPSSVRSPLVGRAAPEFRLVPVGGGAPVTLASLRGQPVVMNFWATYCVPCLEEHELLQDAARATAGRVQFLGVVYDDKEEDVRVFLRRHGGSSYPSLLDVNGGTAIAYGVAGVPETYFIDPQGRIAFKQTGALDEATLRASLDKIVPAQVSEAR